MLLLEAGHMSKHECRAVLARLEMVLPLGHTVCSHCILLLQGAYLAGLTAAYFAQVLDLSQIVQVGCEHSRGLQRAWLPAASTGRSGTTCSACCVCCMDT